MNYQLHDMRTRPTVETRLASLCYIVLGSLALGAFGFACLVAV